MNRSIVILVAFVTLGIIAVSNGAGIPDTKQDMAKVVEINLTGQEVQDKILVTPYGYKQILLQNGETKVDCWICSRPCSNIFCCNDGWPQCCIYQGLCGCCRV